VEKRVPYPVPYTVEKTVYIDTPVHEPILNGTVETDIYYEPGVATTAVSSPVLAIPPPMTSAPIRRPINATQTTTIATRPKRGKLSRLLHRHHRA
jgi:hypothetical protein